MRWRRVLWESPPWRWRSALRAMLRGVRCHPSVALIGPAQRTDLGRGTVLGAHVRVETGHQGRLRTGKGVWLAADVEIETEGEVHIGAGTTVQRRSSLNGDVRIGRGCILAPNVFIPSGTHPFRAYPGLIIREQERRLQQEGGAAALDRPVHTEDDCWFGVNAVICPGVTLGQGSIVGANAVVTRDVEPHTVVGGAPAWPLGRR